MMDHCLSGIGDHDREMILDIYAMYYPEGATDSIHDMIVGGCEQKEKAREAVSEYYDKKTEEETKSETSSDDKYKLAQARECIMRMVSHCMVKKEMGMFGSR
ncbi:uncharacterized protein LOC129220516 isoform X2 [Uloborus diversus]|uniref:uncharacterized protein LOC129220516 isoform X1 n=1 Tax=Uloborus diversus TaxID=327109 RepID=UPI00240A4660|nr:uncharacterized protein LOC129220516 isoform X1 [Uloborus diversus]XP_054710919.1 uncharacterized protein LOC129220516 isoform X2 [Uloborus diversus]